MSDVTTLRSRVLQILFDSGGLIWSDAAIDEALRTALADYSLSLPLECETVLELPGPGREIALESLDGLAAVSDVWWPYDSSGPETWPPNRVRGFHLAWDDARPLLVLDSLEAPQPQAGDEIRLWYTARQTIQDLDGAGVTTLPPAHETLVCQGAAGQAALSRAADLIETAGADLYATGLLGAWASRKLGEFHNGLVELSRARARSGLPFGAGWRLDKWDV